MQQLAPLGQVGSPLVHQEAVGEHQEEVSRHVCGAGEEPVGLMAHRRRRGWPWQGGDRGGAALARQWLELELAIDTTWMYLNPWCELMNCYPQ